MCKYRQTASNSLCPSMFAPPSHPSLSSLPLPCFLSFDEATAKCVLGMNTWCVATNQDGREFVKGCEPVVVELQCCDGPSWWLLHLQVRKEEGAESSRQATCRCEARRQGERQAGGRLATCDLIFPSRGSSSYTSGNVWGRSGKADEQNGSEGGGLRQAVRGENCKCQHCDLCTNLPFQRGLRMKSPTQLIPASHK